jgi:hypothetical protein
MTVELKREWSNKKHQKLPKLEIEPNIISIIDFFDTESGPAGGTLLRRKKFHIFECINCKNQFSVRGRITRKRQRLYCSYKCSSTHKKKCSHEECSKQIMYYNRTGLCDYHYQKKRRKKTKDELFQILGNKCVCCGETDRLYLQVDHVNNDGHAHRNSNEKKHHHHSEYLRYLAKNPGGLQLLCANCNFAKKLNDGELYRPEKFTRRSNQTERKVAA